MSDVELVRIITTSGGKIVFDMPSDHYHQNAALGSSTLKRMASKSPWHAWKTGLDPERPIIEPSEAMKAGTRAHCAILEPDTFNERYTVRPDGHDGRTTQGKAWALEHAGEEIITGEQAHTAHMQSLSVRTLPEIAALLDGDGASEVSAFAIDETTGVEMKARPDRVCETSDDACVLLDIKTTKSARREDFARSVVNFGYALQAVHYLDVYERAAGKLVMGMVFVCVESDYPFAACAFMLPDEWLERARRQRRRLLNVYAECLSSGVWPSYRDTIEVLDMPRWLAEDDA